MVLARVQAFEFNDQPWVPEVLRDTIVESLSRTLTWGHILDGLIEPMADFLDQAKTRAILDLGSGAGAPASILSQGLARRGCPARFTLTDLFARPALWAELARAQPEAIDFIAESVDATAIPEALSAGKARAIINVLHHLPEPIARGVLQDAVRARAPIFVAEGFERNPLRFAVPFGPVGLASLAVSPILGRGHKLARALLVWGTPIALLASAWDGLVSTLRVYTEEELLGMVGRDASYRWTYGNYTWTPFGRGYYFHGVPRD